MIRQLNSQKKYILTQLNRQSWLTAACKALGNPHRLRLLQTFIDCPTPVYVALVKGVKKTGIWSGNTSQWSSAAAFACSDISDAISADGDNTDLLLPSLPILLLSPRSRNYLSRLYHAGLVVAEQRSKDLFLVHADNDAISLLSNFLRRNF